MVFSGIEAIAREFAELEFYRGEPLSEDELQELREISTMAEDIYVRILAKMKRDAGDAPELDIEPVKKTEAKG